MDHTYTVFFLMKSDSGICHQQSSSTDEEINKTNKITHNFVTSAAWYPGTS